MNYLDAIRSGKPYRRMVESKWRPVFDLNSNFCTTVNETFGYVFSEDFEVKQEPREWWLVDTGSANMLAYEKQPDLISNSWRLIRVREVLGEK